MSYRSADNVRNLSSFIPRIKFEKSVHLVGFIIAKISHPTYNEMVLYNVPCKLEDHSVLVMVCGGVKWNSSKHVQHSA